MPPIHGNPPRLVPLPGARPVHADGERGSKEIDAAPAASASSLPAPSSMTPASSAGLGLTTGAAAFLPALQAQGKRPLQHPGMVARLAEVAPRAPTEVVYSRTVGRFEELSAKALDLVEGPFSQRARRRERAETIGDRATYKEVMSEIDKGANKVLAKHLMARIVAAHEVRGTMSAGSPGLQHLRPVDEAALRTLEPWEQKLLTNGAGNLPSVWMDLDSAIFNGLSLTFHRCMRDDGTIDAALVAKELSPAAVDVLRQAEEQFAARDPVLQHWASERRPYEPDDRPVMKRDLAALQHKDRGLYEALLEAAPVPTALPVLAASAAADPTRLDDFAVVMVQHALGSMDPFVRTLVQKGASPDAIDFVPVPYSTNAIVETKLERQGIRVWDSCPDGVLAPRDVETVMERDVLMALDSALKKQAQSGKRMLIIDDGGIVVRLLSGRAKTRVWISS